MVQATSGCYFVQVTDLQTGALIFSRAHRYPAPSFAQSSLWHALYAAATEKGGIAPRQLRADDAAAVFERVGDLLLVALCSGPRFPGGSTSAAVTRSNCEQFCGVTTPSGVDVEEARARAALEGVARGMRALLGGRWVREEQGGASTATRSERSSRFELDESRRRTWKQTLTTFLPAVVDAAFGRAEPWVCESLAGAFGEGFGERSVVEWTGCGASHTSCSKEAVKTGLSNQGLVQRLFESCLLPLLAPSRERTHRASLVFVSHDGRLMRLMRRAGDGAGSGCVGTCLAFASYAADVTVPSQRWSAEHQRVRLFWSAEHQRSAERQRWSASSATPLAESADTGELQASILVSLRVHFAPVPACRDAGDDGAGVASADGGSSESGGRSFESGADRSVVLSFLLPEGSSDSGDAPIREVTEEVVEKVRGLLNEALGPANSGAIGVGPCPVWNDASWIARALRETGCEAVAIRTRCIDGDAALYVAASATGRSASDTQAEQVHSAAAGEANLLNRETSAGGVFFAHGDDVPKRSLDCAEGPSVSAQTRRREGAKRRDKATVRQELAFWRPAFGAPPHGDAGPGTPGAPPDEQRDVEVLRLDSSALVFVRLYGRGFEGSQKSHSRVRGFAELLFSVADAQAVTGADCPLVQTLLAKVARPLVCRLGRPQALLRDVVPQWNDVVLGSDSLE